jgi:hypothetical protein
MLTWFSLNNYDTYKVAATISLTEQSSRELTLKIRVREVLVWNLNQDTDYPDRGFR